MRAKAALSLRNLIYGLLFALAVSLAFIIKSEYVIYILILSCIWIMMTTSYNLLMGYTGLLSLGQAAFMGIGAYASTLIVMNFNVPWPVGMLCAPIFAGLFAALIGLPVTKLRGAYFAFLTFGLGEITRLVIINWDSLTGGSFGIVGVPVMFDSLSTTYIFVFLLMVLVLLMAYRLAHSRIGRALLAIREDEAVAESVGINIARYTHLIYVISAAICGLGGAIMVHYISYCYPGLAQFWYSAYPLIYTVIGGPGYLMGPALIAFIFTALPEMFRFLGTYFPLAYGLLLVVVIVYLPNGLEPVLRSLYSRVVTSVKSRWGTRRN
jgi:branched-chain amino acid transport system permease protein